MDENNDLGSLQRKLGHRFTCISLLERALTHRSCSADHNERLEFLGDSVLNAAMSSLLYARYAQSAEGDLTRVRAHLVREERLHSVALELGLASHVRMSEGEAKAGGRERASMLADVFEAVIGAVYEDAGYEAAKGLVERLFGEALQGTAIDAWDKDAKTALQEWLQARRRSVPVYGIASTSGQAHAQTFDVFCDVADPQAPHGKRQTIGRGRSRRAAEQVAARAMLDALAAGASNGVYGAR